MQEIIFIFEPEGVKLVAQLYENLTGKKVLDHLPIESKARKWGDEIYFPVDFHIEKSPEAKTTIEVGEIAFWPDGDCICIFFGPTPVSTGPEPKAISPVNVFGRLIEPWNEIKLIKEGSLVLVKKKN